MAKRCQTTKVRSFTTTIKVSVKGNHAAAAEKILRKWFKDPYMFEEMAENCMERLQEATDLLQSMYDAPGWDVEELNIAPTRK